MEKRNDFMNFFRDPEKMALLSADDRLELFEMSLTGASDITVERLNRLLVDYDVKGIAVIAVAPPAPKFDVDDIVYYTSILSGFKQKTPLTVDCVRYYKGSFLYESGFYYSFIGINLTAHEKELSYDRPKRTKKNKQ